MKEWRLEGSPATMEALKVIFNHEKIPYQIGFGPKGLVYTIESKDVRKTKETLHEWFRAIENVKSQVF